MDTSFKKDDPLTKSNYRPVTVLTTADKVFEQLLCKELTVLTDRLIVKPIISLLESYFEDRKNRVRLGNVKSEWKTAKRGCPQGSALGLVLWNIYQNDLFYSAIRAQLNTYADDHQLYLSDQKASSVVRGPTRKP